MKRKTSSLLLGVVLFALGCSQSDQQNNRPVPQIPVVDAIQKDVPIYREFVGQAYGLYDIPIRARVEGFLEGIFFKEGSDVKKGQLLYTIDSQPFLAEVASQKSKVAEAKTNLINAKSQLDRYKPLAEEKAVSELDLDAAQARYDAAVASVEAAEANLQLAQINLSYTKLKSPINGLIGKTSARVGEFVGRDPNPVILNTVSRIDTIRVQFYLTEAQYLTLARSYKEDNSNGKARIQLILADGKLYDHDGVVDFIDRNIDSSTGSILVQASFSNPQMLLRPGMYAKVKVEMAVDHGSVLVPQRCVMELQGQHSVYVVKEDNTVETRQVITGDKVGELWVIKEGLKPGEKVIIEGLQKVGSGVKVDPVPYNEAAGKSKEEPKN
ncbi:MAG: efflux RND transporter periplasmic adaptor subunit [Cyclobacteriaceae bacterium]|nr:efflux RND transporter periplasmic adaptor subunit [Cyclobacteriaceae bacterium]